LEPGSRFKDYQIVAIDVMSSCLIWHRGSWTHRVSMSPPAGDSCMTIPVILQRNIPAWSQHEGAWGLEVPQGPGHISPPLVQLLILCWQMFHSCYVSSSQDTVYSELAPDSHSVLKTVRVPVTADIIQTPLNLNSSVSTAFRLRVNRMEQTDGRTNRVQQ